MTIDEIKKEIEKLINEWPMEGQKNIFILFYDDDDKSKGNYIGVGCAACAFDIMMLMAIKGQLEHNGPKPNIE